MPAWLQVAIKVILFVVAWGWIFGFIPIGNLLSDRNVNAAYDRRRDIRFAVALLAWIGLGWFIFRFAIPAEINPFCDGHVCDWTFDD